MADSANPFGAVSASAGAAAFLNAQLNALSPSALFGLNPATTTALTWGYYGGKLMIDGTITSIANGTLLLTGSTTNFVEATRAGVVSSNTTAFTAGRIPLYSVVTGASTITSYTDQRTTPPPQPPGRLQLAMTDANATLTAIQARNAILRFTGTLTVQRDIVLPLAEQIWIVNNATTGGFGLRFIGATGTGIVVAAGTHATVYADGTNIVRATADV